MRFKPFITRLSGIAILLISGCDKEKYELKFSHNLHVIENEMSCDECHGELDPGGFNPISHATCIDCHDESEAEEISVLTCGVCHQEKQLSSFELTAVLEEEPEKIATEGNDNLKQSVFVHTEALAGKCNDCHSSLLNESVVTVAGLERADVLAIRETAHASDSDCTMCHVGLSRDQAPPSHNMAWQRRHGLLGIQEDASCSVCHTENSCTECHSVMQPVSHNNLFRTRTHAIVAAWDRNSCMVCHEQDTCTSCHANTRPRSHNARWAASGMRPTHCIGCHNTSTAGDGCATCHEGGNDVMLHEQYWGGINHNQPGIENCYQCHWVQTP